MAHTVYIAFLHLVGSAYMSEQLPNDSLLRHLCSQHHHSSSSTSSSSGRPDRGTPSDSGLGTASDVDSHDDSIAVEGDKLVIRPQSTPVATAAATEPPASNRVRMEISDAKTRRHLRGNWLAYWEHEVGRSDRDTAFQVKQIALQGFVGHKAAIRAIYVLDSENSFITASKDRTVRLWSLRNRADGSASVGPQWTYVQHKKPLQSIAFLESVHLVASTDGLLHIWDPFVPCNTRVVNMQKLVNGSTSQNTNVTIVHPLPAPSCSLVTATANDTVLRLVDVRTGKFTHDLQSAVPSAGMIHCITTSPDGHVIGLGYTTGVLSTLDLRTGLSLASWKAHEADILDVKAVDSRRLVSSSLDQTIAVWKQDEGKQLAHLRGPAEPVHFLSVYKESLISASTTNRINVNSSFDSLGELTSTKLKTNMVRGSLSSIAVLPLNRLLLLGTDSGAVQLIA